MTGFDISTGQLRAARSRLTGAVRLVLGDIVHLPFRDAAFDVALCFGGALSYVGDQRHKAAAELVRVTRPGGSILISVMSRYGAIALVGREPTLDVLHDPEGQHLWSVFQTGNLPPVPSSVEGQPHPAMHLYTSDELRVLLPDCDVVEVAASNVAVYERGGHLASLPDDEAAWKSTLEIERRLSQAPGLVDGGSHILLAARRRH